MTRKYFGHLDGAKNQLQNWLMHLLGSAPGSPVEGLTYFDTTDHVPRFYDGSGWVDMKTGAPTGAAGGALGGTYPNPTVDDDGHAHTTTTVSGLDAADVTTGTFDDARIPAAIARDSEVTSAISTSESGQVRDGDTAGGDLSGTYPSPSVTDDSHAHTTTTISGLVAADTTDFDTQVRTSRLSQMVAPATDVSWNTHKITNLLDPTSAQDAASKAYVDSLANGQDWKNSVRVATTVAGTLATDFENGDTIDGVVLATGNRILIKNQAAGAANGLYVVAASGAPARADDANVSAEVTGGLSVWVTEGTANADTAWTLSTNDAIVLDTTALVFTQSSSLGQISVTAPITKSGSTLSFTGAASVGSAGPGGGLTNAGAIDTDVVVRKYAVAIGDGAATSFTVTHSLSTRDVTVSVIQAATPWDHVFPTISSTSTSALTVDFGATVPTSGQYRCVVHG